MQQLPSCVVIAYFVTLWVDISSGMVYGSLLSETPEQVKMQIPGPFCRSMEPDCLEGGAREYAFLTHELLRDTTP